ncbi:MAG: hypothetical protein ABIE84_05920 [bacterium]
MAEKKSKHFDADFLAIAHYRLAELALEQNDLDTFFATADKIMGPKSGDELQLNILRLLCLVKIDENTPLSDLKTRVAKLQTFLNKHLRPDKLRRESDESITNWYLLFITSLPIHVLIFCHNPLLNLNHEYSQRFGHEKPIKKEAVSGLLRLSALAHLSGKPVDIQDLATKAESVIGLAGVARVAEDLEIFAVNLCVLGLFDLAERELNQQNVPSDSPLRQLIAITRHGVQNFSPDNDVYQEFINSNSLHDNNNRFVLAFLYTRDLNAYCARTAADTKPWKIITPNDAIHLADLPKTLAQSLAGIRRKLIEGQKEALLRHAAYKSAVILSTEPINTIVYVPQTNTLDHFFHLEGQGTFRASYKLSSNQQGLAVDLASEAEYSGFSRQTPKDIPYFLVSASIFHLAKLIDPHQAKGIKDKLNDLSDQAVHECRLAVFSHTSALDFGILLEQFNNIPEYQDELAITLENLLYLGRAVLAHCPAFAAAETIYTLEENDLLKPLIRSVTIYSPAEARTLMRGFGVELAPGTGKFPIVVQFYPTKGESVIAVIKNPQTMEIAGVTNETGTLLKKYLLELTFEAFAKLNDPKPRPAREVPTTPPPKQAEQIAQTTYLKEESPGLILVPGLGSAAYDALSEIYTRLFHGREDVSPWDRPWCTPQKVKDKKGKEYRFILPISDQSRESKNAILAELGTDNIRVQTQPFGKIVCLPVREKEGELQPWARTDRAIAMRQAFRDDRPLGTMYALYVMTRLSKPMPGITGSGLLVHRNAVRATEQECLDDQLITKVQKEIESGELDRQLALLSPAKREPLREAIKKEEVTIVTQTPGIYEVALTYAAPTRKSLTKFPSFQRPG